MQTTSRDEFLAKGSGKLIHVAANSVNETAEQELQRAIEAEIANSAKPWLEKPLVPVKPAVKKQPTTAEQVIPTPKPQKPIPTPKPSSIAKLVEKIEQQPQEQASVQQTVVIVGETTGITASLGLSVPPPKPFARPQKREKITVVIDPGHGGIDPGTISLNGVYEKNITLAMARAMKKKLENTGRYKVLITRNRDIFIALRGRVKFAHDAKAALFISLHADSVKNPNTRGASIYTLSERASDKEAAALADKENKADMIAGIDLTGESQEVTNILIDLAQRETMNQSGSFAKFLVKRLRKKTRLLRNTHRFAGFAVLKAPDVPSVLLEMGFLSNGKDERALRSRSHREKMAVAITAAIDDYFKHIGKAVQ